jgi:RNA polymerase sigma factor (sigma-70 family)
MDACQPVDLDLIRQILQGRAAFNALHERYRKRVFDYISRRVRRREDADNIAQEVWLKVHLKLDSFDPGRGNLEAFIIDIAHWRILEHYEGLHAEEQNLLLEHELRTRTGDEGGSDAAPVDWLDRRASQAPSTEDAAAVAELYEEALEFVLAGPCAPHQVVVFCLQELLEWEPREICAELSEKVLHWLACRIETDYCASVPHREESVRRSFQPFFRKMELLVGEAIVAPRTRNLYRELLSRLTGDTLLREYYRTEDPAEELPNWTWSVSRAVVAELARRRTQALEKSGDSVRGTTGQAE